jgi:molecular chaperone GrpE
MRPEGQQFDPNYHEAMLREATNEHPEGTVIEQLMRGYLLEEQVLRHAMVKVAVPGNPVITSEGDNREEESNVRENQST